MNINILYLITGICIGIALTCAVIIILALTTKRK